MGNEKKRKFGKKKRKIVRGDRRAPRRLPPFRLFLSLSLCLRQRSDQAESTISKVITLGDREKRRRKIEVARLSVSENKIARRRSNEFIPSVYNILRDYL